MIVFLSCGRFTTLTHTTRLPEDRCRDLQRGNPVRIEILGAVSGTEKTAQRLHFEFAELAQRNEHYWYESTPALTRRVSELLLLETSAHVSFYRACKYLGLSAEHRFPPSIRVLLSAGGHQRVLVSDLPAPIEPDDDAITLNTLSR